MFELALIAGLGFIYFKSPPALQGVLKGVYLVLIVVGFLILLKGGAVGAVLGAVIDVFVNLFQGTFGLLFHLLSGT